MGWKRRAGWWGLVIGKGELSGMGMPGSMCFFAGAFSSLVKTTGSRDIEAELSDSRRFAYRDMPPRGGGGGADIVCLLMGYIGKWVARVVKRDRGKEEGAGAIMVC